MNRQELEERLVDYLYDELGDSERSSFEAGLRDNPDLAAEVSAHSRTRGAMQSLEVVQPSRAVMKDVMAEARRGLQKEETVGFVQRILSFLMQPAVATSMVFLLVASASIVLSQEELKDSAPGEQAPLAVSIHDSKKRAATSADPMVAGVEAPGTDFSIAEAKSPATQPAADDLFDNERALAVAPKASRNKKRRANAPEGEKLEEIAVAEAMRPGGPRYIKSKTSDWKYELNAGPAGGGSVALGFAGDGDPAAGKSENLKAVSAQDLLGGDSSAERTRADADDNKGMKKRPKPRSKEGRKLLLEVTRSLKLGLFKKAQAALDRLKKIAEFRPEYLRARASLKKAQASRKSKTKAAPAKRAY